MFSWTKKLKKRSGYKKVEEGEEEYFTRFTYRGMLSYPGLYDPYGLGLYKHGLGLYNSYGMGRMGLYGNDHILW